MHRAAVDAFEARAASGMDLTAVLGTVAFHAVQAGDPRRAIDYSERAGEVAMARGANAEAARLFRQAIELARSANAAVDNLRRARWERRAAEALDGIGDLQSAKAHLRRAGALLGWPEPTKNAALALGLIWQVAVQLVRRTVWGPSPVGSSVLPRWQEAALTYETLVHIHYYQSATLPLMYTTFLGLRLAERCPNSPVLSGAYSYAYATMIVTPFRRGAATYLRLAEWALAKKPDQAAESYTRLLQAVASLGQGQLEHVKVWAQRAMALSEPLRFRRRWEEAAAVLANASHFHGENDVALEWSSKVIGSARERGDPQTLSWGLAVRGATYLSTGLLDEALIDLNEAVSLARGVGRNETLWAEGLLAMACLRRRDTPSALELSRTVQPRYEQHRRSSEEPSMVTRQRWLYRSPSSRRRRGALPPRS